MVLRLLLYGGLAALAVIVVLSFTPVPNAYNVAVTVNSTEVAIIIGQIFSINSVNGVTTGSSTVIDWGATGLGFAWASLSGTFTMTVCVASHCSSESAQSWFPSVPVIGGASVSATNTFNVGYVQSGHAAITVTLTENGQVVSTGSGSMCVNGGSC